MANLKNIKRTIKRTLKEHYEKGARIHSMGIGTKFNSETKTIDVNYSQSPSLCALTAVNVGYEIENEDDYKGYCQTAANVLGIECEDADNIESGFMNHSFRDNKFYKIGLEIRKELEKEGIYNNIKLRK